MKDCGGCTVCCKLLNVPGLAGCGEQCPHACPGTGCMIYEERPDVCLGFDCFWRAESWPDELRPDKCNVLFEALPGVKTILVSVEPDDPDAWKKPKILRVIHILRDKGRPLVLKTKNDSMMFIPDGWSKEDVLHDIKQVIDWQQQEGR